MPVLGVVLGGLHVARGRRRMALGGGLGAIEQPSCVHIARDLEVLRGGSWPWGAHPVHLKQSWRLNLALHGSR
jgi:hypothetical protein